MPQSINRPSSFSNDCALGTIADAVAAARHHRVRPAVSLRRARLLAAWSRRRTGTYARRTTWRCVAMERRSLDVCTCGVHRMSSSINIIIHHHRRRRGLQRTGELGVLRLLGANRRRLVVLMFAHAAGLSNRFVACFFCDGCNKISCYRLSCWSIVSRWFVRS